MQCSDWCQLGQTTAAKILLKNGAAHNDTRGSQKSKQRVETSVRGFQEIP